MAITSYSTLQSAIIDTAMRTGDTAFAAAVPNFITGAEQLMNYGDGEGIPALRTRDMETSATITLTSGSGSLPADYLEWRTVYTQDATPIVLKPVPPDFRIDQYGTASAGYGYFFDIIGSTIKTAPPSQTNLTIDYYAKITALSDANTTNWLLTKAPMLYLYGALIHAAPYMLDDERTQTWAQFYTKGVNGLMASERASKYARMARVNRMPTP